MKKYFPILLSKRGELTALRHLSQSVKEEICPIIEVLSDNLNDITKHLNTHWSFTNIINNTTNMVMLDFSWYAELGTNIRTVRNFITGLLNNGIHVVPVVQENSPAAYINLVQSLIASHACQVCIRASNRSGGFINYNTTINNLVTQLAATRANTHLLIDLGYVEVNNYNTLASLAQTLVSGITHRNQFANIIVASGSFPENVTSLSVQNHPHHLQRYEWDIWQLLIGNGGLRGIIKYADYGTKYPYYIDISFAGSCSLKYSSANRYTVYRGELAKTHPHGNGQFISHAQKLIATGDYAGVGFSWGDLRITQIAAQTAGVANTKPGSLETWVQISQNHHVTLLHGLL